MGFESAIILGYSAIAFLCVYLADKLRQDDSFIPLSHALLGLFLLTVLQISFLCYRIANANSAFVVETERYFLVSLGFVFFILFYIFIQALRAVAEAAGE